jgi:hypothetical protein
MLNFGSDRVITEAVAMPFLIDQIAKEIAVRRFGLPECLHVPIAAVDKGTISAYIGDILRVLTTGGSDKALLVHAKEPPPTDARLPIWELPESAVFHRRMQVWVDVAYTRYRQAYLRAFPSEEIESKILSHTMNRRVASLKGFQYVRITPTSRGSNSSSGFSEKWGVALHSQPEQMQANRNRGVFIQYADLSDLMLMLDIKLGGGVMTAVNEGQKLLTPRKLDEFVITVKS